MGTSSSVLEMLFVLLLIESLEFSSVRAHLNAPCVKNERDALFKIKQGLADISNRLSSWTGEDCCTWKGVVCSNRTGHVIMLDLRNDQLASFGSNSSLGGEIHRSLLNLTHLQFLDLSYNNFSGAVFPSFIGSLQHLRYLNLSHAYFEGQVPHHLGNLSNLQYLDLSWNYGLTVDKLQWVSTISSLKHLDLSGLKLTQADDWFHAINMIPSLLELHLSSCYFSHIPLFLHINLSSLAVLDLSHNGFNSTIPGWLFNFTNIQYLNLSSCNFQGSLQSDVGNYDLLKVLDLSYNQLEGEIPQRLKNLCTLQELNLAHNRFRGAISESFGNTSVCRQSSLKSLILEINYLSGSLPENLGNFNHLEVLNLYSNSLRGPIPESLGKLSRLRVLSLSHNYLNGSVPASLGQLSSLETLDLHNNSLVGIVSEIHFSKLEALTTLYLYRNSLVFDVGPTWKPPFQIQRIALYSCKIGPQFPQWLQTQTNISILEMSNTSISDSIPGWFENISSNIVYLDLSYNQIGKNLPKLRQSFGAPYRFVYLGSNHFNCSLTLFPPDVTELDISNNFLWGRIPEIIDSMMPRLSMLLLSNNSLNGTVPVSLCKMQELEYLDLSSNHFSGRLPRCWSMLQRLQVMDMSSNAIRGHLPPSMGSLQQLRSLHLEHNSLQGKIPVSLKKLKNLLILDLSENAFDGIIPSWIGESLSSLRVLSVHSNSLDGHIPKQLCQLSSLRILNLASNNLSGAIPDCFGNLTAMIVSGMSVEDWLYRPTVFGEVFGYQNVVYDERVLVYIKGIQLEYTNTLLFLLSIDLSSNNFLGEIPAALTSLSGLKNLNLSGNNLEGHVPSEIGKMKSLESLDLSRNELSGSIPPSISELNFLSVLNLSFNNLSGPIPSGNQMQTLADKSVYMGNERLCGAPLNSCQVDGPADDGEQFEGGSDDEPAILSFYSGLGMGFALGFVVACSSLYLKSSWRNAFFGLIDKVYSNLCVTAEVKAHQFLRMFHS